MIFIQANNSTCLLFKFQIQAKTCTYILYGSIGEVRFVAEGTKIKAGVRDKDWGASVASFSVPEELTF